MKANENLDTTGFHCVIFGSRPDIFICFQINFITIYIHHDNLDFMPNDWKLIMQLQNQYLFPIGMILLKHTCTYTDFLSGCYYL